MDINKVVEIIFYIFVPLIILINVIAVYLIIIGGNMNKTYEEQRLEDKEQMEYLKNYKRKNGGIRWKE